MSAPLAPRWFVVRACVALPCLAGALMLLTVPAAASAWAGLGLPAWGRWLLGMSEAIAATLFLVPPFAAVGAVLLAVVLCAALVLHLRLDQPAGWIWVYLGGSIVWIGRHLWSAFDAR